MFAGDTRGRSGEAMLVCIKTSRSKVIMPDFREDCIVSCLLWSSNLSINNIEEDKLDPSARSEGEGRSGRERFFSMAHVYHQKVYVLGRSE